MLTGISLTDFKNFHDTTLILGPLTLLVGTNAAGKSNIRDAIWDRINLLFTNIK